MPALTKTVISFGETMLRLAPPGFERFLQSPQFIATFGGGEANVGVAVAQFGMSARYVTQCLHHGTRLAPRTAPGVIVTRRAAPGVRPRCRWTTWRPPSRRHDGSPPPPRRPRRRARAARAG